MSKSVASKTGLLVLFIGLMLPFGVILFLLLTEIKSRISLWEDARSGVRYHRNVRQILDHTLTYADLAAQSTGAKDIDGKTLSQIKKTLERDIKNFDSLPNQQRPGAQWRAFKTSWEQLQKTQGGAKSSNLDSLLEHIVAISAQADDRIVRVPSARSDGDAMDTLIADIPALAVDIERAARWNLKSGDKDQIRSLSAMIASSLADSTRKIPAPVGNELPASVQLYQRAKTSTRKFLAALDNSLLSEKTPPENLFAFSQKSRAAYFGLYDELSRDMENNIAAHIESDGQRKFFIEVFAALVVTIIVCIFWRIADLTTQHSRAEQSTRESEARFRSIVDAARDAVVGMDMNGLIREWNPQAEALFGWSREEAIGQRLSAVIIPPEFREAHEKGLNRYLETGEAVFLDKRVEVTAQDRRNNRFSVELSITVVHVNGVPMFNAFVRDITARKQAEAQLQQAKEDAETANISKSQFLANMSHELRTPLNAIIGYSEMLQEEAEDSGQEDFVPDLQKIQVAGKHLLALINDILDLSKIEAGKMDIFLEEFDVAEMIRGVVTIITPLAQKNSNQLIVNVAEDVGSMRADLTKVRQSLFNLLSNACKFTHEGNVTLEASRSDSSDGETLVFRVLDNGIGLSEEQMNKLFQAFTQADASTTRKYGGTGLGLAISRRFCQMMGGDITVESQQGEGSTFTITLPAQVAEPVRDDKAELSNGEKTGAPDSGETWLHQAVETQSTESNRGARRVLVIDDDPAVHAVIRRHLNKEGMKVMTAHSGTEGLYMAKAMRPDVITLDVLMPGMDGWAVLAALKEDRELVDIPVVMLSSMDDVGLATTLGAAGYLTKPIDGSELLACLRKPQRNQPVYPLLLVQPDGEARRETQRVLEKYGWRVEAADDERAALRRLAEMPHEPCVILMQWNKEESDGFLQSLQQNEKWNSIHLVVITTTDLGGDEQSQLNESASHVFWNGENHDDLLRDIRSLVATSTHSKTAQ